MDAPGRADYDGEQRPGCAAGRVIRCVRHSARRSREVHQMTMLAGMGPTIGKQAPAVEPAVSITITERAAIKAKQLLAEKGHEEGMLRVFVVGGGCSGYQYGM